jgi:hypothetical protein
MVVTTAQFTKGARELAKSNDCELIARGDLGRWIAAFCERGKRGKPGARVARGLLAAALIIANLLIGHELSKLERRLVAPRAEPKLSVSCTQLEKTVAYEGNTPNASRSRAAEVDSHLPIQLSDSLFEVVEDSPVFRSPSNSSAILARVHEGRTLHVIGVPGGFVQIRMNNGTIGFVPKAIATYKSAWLEPGDD